MPTATATVVTDHASRYLQQLCKHWSHKFQAEFDPTAGTIHFDAERTLVLIARDDRLELELTVADPDALERMQGVVAEHLQRFAFREALAIAWQPI
ncbi:DUF2218 domain-containing protein [Mangrovibrevibacter kandeliae]|uniref:DUF2218 domain-containing protein n=1 Tax=Mangrovibrevibacter kandeliae TaxID=2968473 RepID=UPI002117F8EE|nr:DUF2218 domain-containing protein [Aurantimonas sp. CSK15Z-1]MCQ8781916.1 DUF2218 domain-containing protein [Aurantimonas sp. CSK15Z-1]